jgi:hypothetical protein
VTDTRVIGGGLRAVAFPDAVAPIGSPKPRALRHRATFRPVTPPAGPLQSIAERGSVAVVDRPPVTLGPTVRDGWWLVSHALSNGSSDRYSRSTDAHKSRSDSPSTGPMYRNEGNHPAREEFLTSSPPRREGIPTGSPARRGYLRWVPHTTGLHHPKIARGSKGEVPPHGYCTLLRNPHWQRNHTRRT